MKSFFRDFNTEMYQNCILPSNMTEGSEVRTFGNAEYDPFQAFEDCFSYLSSKGQDDGVLILTTSYEWREDEMR